ncbi:class F sortase [Geodermatophilus aquaeductus]|uniref:Sortase family protein n=1 Tax=Geodermatophilus aquaeductus TaxID=1564161 RepID=A0A521DXI7_9ACTN|nr:class F sortase [Geodermatophilus aquaeductus]SMO76433.1 Sortase family protein [Geodermatophilus aquaeductus]
MTGLAGGRRGWPAALGVGLRRRGRWASALLGAAGLVLLLWGLPRSPEAALPRAAAPPSAQDLMVDPVAGAGGTGTATPTSAPQQSRPVHLDIPRIELRTDLVPVGLNPDGTVVVPPLVPGAPAAWYQYLASPGDPGPAVLLGHVDTYRGPAVFHRVHELRSGDAIEVQRADGRFVDFVVDAVHTYAKTEFPSEAVYGPSAEPVLRLLTCGGTFDRERRTYLSVVVVYASLGAAPGR